MLLWEEYWEQHSKDTRTAGSASLRPWLSRRDLVLRQEYKAGQKMSVDSVGKTVPSSTLSPARSARPRSSMPVGTASRKARCHPLRPATDRKAPERRIA
jgi:hypothetical protein